MIFYKIFFNFYNFYDKPSLELKKEGAKGLARMLESLYKLEVLILNLKW